MRLPAFLAILFTTALVTAAPASAGTVCSVGGTAIFAAADVASLCPGGANGAGETNSLSVSANATGDIVFTDTNAMADGDGPGGCSVSGNTGTCPGALGYRFDLGDGNDAATVGTAAASGTSTGGAGSDHLTAGPLPAAFDGGAGNDTLTGGGGADALSGSSGNDTIDGGGGDDVIDGGSEDDALTGGDGGDVLQGDDGNDTLDGGAGGDTLDGDAGNDSLGGGAGGDILAGGLGDDAESGGDGDDQLDGGSTFGCSGSGGSDTLNGGAGDDALCGGAGDAGDNDVLSGGDGQDTAYYVRAAAVNVSLDGSAGDGSAGESDNVQPDVENLTGGSGDDRLTGNDGRNVLDGGAGADAVTGLGGDDVLMDSGGDSAADTLDGGAGDDTLSAGLGPDTYIGGDGEDSVTDYAKRSASVSVTLDGAADDGQAGENDNVATDVEDVTGGSADDVLIGSNADNELDGGAGDDTIAGGGGNDGLHGGAGRDTIDGGSGRDYIEGGGGGDTLKSRDGLTDRIECNGGTDTAQVEARDDVAGDCENVQVAAPAPITILSVQVTRAGFTVVRFTCPDVEKQCTGTVFVKSVRRLGGRFISLVKLNYRLRGGQLRTSRVKIAKGDRKPLKKARRVKVRTLITNTNSETGASTNATQLATVTTRGL